MASPFAGSLVALVTPFGRDGRLDDAAIRDLVDWHAQSGTAGIVVAGTTGEAATLRTGERERLCRLAVKTLRGRCPVIVGTGTNATRSTVELSRAAGEWGVDGLLVVTPYYNKPNQEGLFQHFEAAARAAAGLPVIAYDVPGRTAVAFEEETIRRLAEVPGIVALKDASGNVERAGRIATETGLDVLSGDDALTLPLMRRGAKGVISVAANVVPEKMARLCATLDEELNESLLPLFRALFCDSNPIPVKFALAHMGRIENELRLPLVPLASELEAEVLDRL